MFPTGNGCWPACGRVDIFNASTSVWGTAALSLDRYWISATSLPNLGIAMFAGGRGLSFDVTLSGFWCLFLFFFVEKMITQNQLSNFFIFSWPLQLKAALFTPLMLWTSTMATFGAPQFSVSVDIGLQPRRCRMMESRFLLVAAVWHSWDMVLYVCICRVRGGVILEEWGVIFIACFHLLTQEIVMLALSVALSTYSMKPQDLQ
jgi:hypothetical protein